MYVLLLKIPITIKFMLTILNIRNYLNTINSEKKVARKCSAVRAYTKHIATDLTRSDSVLRTDLI